jgi:hypothetical protein
MLLSSHVEFASENYGDGNLADSNNKNLGNTPAEIQRNQTLVNPSGIGALVPATSETSSILGISLVSSSYWMIKIGIKQT